MPTRTSTVFPPDGFVVVARAFFAGFFIAGFFFAGFFFAAFFFAAFFFAAFFFVPIRPPSSATLSEVNRTENCEAQRARWVIARDELRELVVRALERRHIAQLRCGWDTVRAGFPQALRAGLDDVAAVRDVSIGQLPRLLEQLE